MKRENLEIYLDHKARIAKSEGFNSAYLSAKFFMEAVKLLKTKFYAPNESAYPRFVFEGMQFIRQPPSNISSTKHA